MQLLIANAEKEAAGSTSRTSTRLRRVITPTPSSEPSKPAKTKIPKPSQPPPKPKIEVSITQRRTEEVSSETEARAEDMLTSPKVAVYDEWQELVKKAQEQGEAGLGRSRRPSRRPHSVDDDVPTSPRKRQRTDDSVIHPPLYKVTANIEQATSIVVETVCPATKPETATTELPSVMDEPVKEEMPSPKIRRNVASLMGDDIPKVKLEMAGVAPAQYLPSIAPLPREEKVARKEFLNAEVKRVVSRRHSQPQKLPETTILEDNRLFMFAILATEGITE